MKKIVSSFSIAILIILWSCVVYAAKLQAKIEITPSSTEIVAGEKATFTLKLTNVANAEGGIVGAIAGTISYDKNFFEGLEYTGITMNEETGRFSKMDSFSNNSNIGTITLKVKSNATGTGKVEFTNLEANDGRDDYEEGEATTPDETITIEVKQSTAEGNTQGQGEQASGGTSGKTTEEDKTGEDKNQSEGEQKSGEETKKEDEKTTGSSEKITEKEENGSTEGQKTLSSNKILTTKEEKQKSGNLPKAGEKPKMTFIIIAILGIDTIVLYNKYRKYKSI